MMEDEFESGEAFPATLWACSGPGEGTADAAGGPATTAAGALVSEEIGLSVSAAADVGAAGFPGAVFDSCATRVAGALRSDLGFNRLAAGAGTAANDDSERGPLEFVGVAAAGALVVTSEGEFELPAGWVFLPDRYRDGPSGGGGFGAGAGEAACFFWAFASNSSFGNGGISTGQGAALTE